MKALPRTRQKTVTRYAGAILESWAGFFLHWTVNQEVFIQVGQDRGESNLGPRWVWVDLKKVF